jgi:hypothetical protein
MLKENPYSFYGTTDLVNRHLSLCTSNQYLKVEVERGIIRRVKRQSRMIGYMTLGISLLFTSPYVQIEAVEGIHNRDCVTRLKDACKCTVLFHMVEGDEVSADV